MFPKIVVPQNGWFVMENRIKMDDLGGTTVYGNTHLKPPPRFPFNIFFCPPPNSPDPPPAWEDQTRQPPGVNLTYFPERCFWMAYGWHNMKGERKKWPKTYVFKGEHGLAVGKLVLKLEHLGFSQGHPFLTVVEFLRLRFHRSPCRSWYNWWWHHPSIGLTSCHHWLGSFKKTTCHFLTYFYYGYAYPCIYIKTARFRRTCCWCFRNPARKPPGMKTNG